MTTRLTIDELTAVSVVDKGANNRRFAFWKRAPQHAPAEPEQEQEEVAKAAGFLDTWNASQAMDTLYDAFWLLDALLWDIRFSDEATDKAAATKQAITEFAQLLGEQIAKRGAELANGNAAEGLAKSLSARIEKAGARHSKADKELIVQIRQLLDQLDDPPEGDSAEDVEKKEESVTPEEIQVAIADAVATGVREAVEGLDLAKSVEAAVAGAVKPYQEQAQALGEHAEALGKRVAELESQPGVAKSLKGQEGAQGASDRRWPSLI